MTGELPVRSETSVGPLWPTQKAENVPECYVRHGGRTLRRILPRIAQEHSVP